MVICYVYFRTYSTGGSRICRGNLYIHIYICVRGILCTSGDLFSLYKLDCAQYIEYLSLLFVPYALLHIPLHTKGGGLQKEDFDGNMA